MRPSRVRANLPLAHYLLPQATLSSLHDASLDQIVAFVKASAEGGDSLYTALSGQALLRTGLIVGASGSLSSLRPFVCLTSPRCAGASPGSSSLLYASLVRQLTRPLPADQATQQRPCLVSRLASRDCSNIKNALRSLIGGFVGSDIEIDGDDEGDEEDLHVRAASTANLREG